MVIYRNGLFLRNLTANFLREIHFPEQPYKQIRLSPFWFPKIMLAHTYV